MRAKKYCICLLLLLFTAIAYSADTDILRIYFINYDIYTLAPLSADEVIKSNQKCEAVISPERRKEIQSLLKPKKHVSTVPMIQFSVDFLESQEGEDSARAQAGPRILGKKKIDDRTLNVRYVLELWENKKTTVIVIGRARGLVRINKKYYEIPPEKFDALVGLCRTYTTPYNSN